MGLGLNKEKNKITDKVILKIFLRIDGTIDRNKLTEKWLDAHKKFKNYLLNRFPKDEWISYSFVIKRLKFKKYELNKCKTCGKKLINKNLNKHYCSSKCIMNNKEVRQKQVITGRINCEKRYGKGITSPNQVEEIKEKQKQGILKHFNTRSLKTAYRKIWDKALTEFRDRTGVEYPMQDEKTRSKVEKSVEKHFGVKYGFNIFSEEQKDKRFKTLLERYGTRGTYPNNKKDTKPNREFKQLLKKYKIKFKQEVYLTYNKKGYYYDFYLTDYNLFIEINPTSTHSNFKIFKQKDTIDKYYHLNKTTAALNNGIDCVCLWDWIDKKLFVQNLLEENVSIIYTNKILKKFYNIKTNKVMKAKPKNMKNVYFIYTDGVELKYE